MEIADYFTVIYVLRLNYLIEVRFLPKSSSSSDTRPLFHEWGDLVLQWAPPAKTLCISALNTLDLYMRDNSLADSGWPLSTWQSKFWLSNITSSRWFCFCKNVSHESKLFIHLIRPSQQSTEQPPKSLNGTKPWILLHSAQWGPSASRQGYSISERVKSKLERRRR
jgi:hypothetical protein